MIIGPVGYMGVSIRDLTPQLASQLGLSATSGALVWAVQTAFDSAVARWQRIIYVSLPPVLFQDSANDCGQGSPAVPPTTIQCSAR